MRHKHSKDEYQGDWAALMYVHDRRGEIVLVFDESHPTPNWKMPVGRKEPHETKPKQTAVRELREETGLTVPKKHFKLRGILQRPNHRVYLFEVPLDSFKGLAEYGDEDGQRLKVDVFSESDLLEGKQRMLAAHRTILRDLTC